MDYFSACCSLDEQLAELPVIESRFTENQLVYLRQYRQINRRPRINDLRAIGLQLNNDSFYFFLDLDAWFTNLSLIDSYAIDIRRHSKKVAG